MRFVVAVNQAWHGHPGWLVSSSGGTPGPAGAAAVTVWAKAMPDGGHAVLVINQGSKPQMGIKVELSSLGLQSSANARDIWALEDLGTVQGTWTIKELASHDSAFVRFSEAVE